MATDSSYKVNAEVAALERLENPHRLIMGEILLALERLHCGWIFVILAVNKDNY